MIKKLSNWKIVLIVFGIVAVLLIIILPSVLLTLKAPEIFECTFGNGNFTKYVVVADSDICSEIGCKILSKGGNIIDAMIGTGFCSGVVNLHSTGIGGGGFMVYYNSKKEEPTFVDFRESAPISVNEELYTDKLIDKASGVGSVAVPSAVPGFYYIWKKYGKISWYDLVDPSRKLLEEGFPFSSSSSQALEQGSSLLANFPELKASLTNPSTGEYYTTGEIYTDMILGETFRRIRDDPNDFISGELGKIFFEDLCKDEIPERCFLTDEDRFNYVIKESEPSKREIFGKIHYTASFPSSAMITGFLMKVIEFSNITSFDKNNPIEYSRFLHRFIEAMKFGYGLRTHFGDPTDIPIPDLLKESYEYISDDNFAKYVAEIMITDNTTNPDIEYYNIIKVNGTQPEDSGTSHISILDSDGNAVSMTTTINGGFGSRVRSPSTGIIYNNEMDDFSAKGDTNIFGFKESPNNFVKPGRRPLSSMSPTIMVDKETKKAVLVSGASGGSRIISATSETILNYLIGRMDIYESMDEPRVHHQFDPNKVSTETSRPLDQHSLELLILRNHEFTNSTSFASVQSAVNENGLIFASADSRKNGIPSGY